MFILNIIQYLNNNCNKAMQVIVTAPSKFAKKNEDYLFTRLQILQINHCSRVQSRGTVFSV